VLSGEATIDDVANQPSPPDIVASNIAEFGDLLASSRGVKTRK